MAATQTAPAYSLHWPTKFVNIDDDALVMLNRISKFCRDMKNKYSEDDLSFVLGASESDTKKYHGYSHKMVYETAKKNGGRKVCVAIIKRRMLIDGRYTTKTWFMPVPKVEPHIHMMLIGKHAAKHAQELRQYLNKQSGSKGKVAWQKPLWTSNDIAYSREYIEGQSTHCRHI